jgi:hypothetical protein
MCWGSEFVNISRMRYADSVFALGLSGLICFSAPSLPCSCPTLPRGSEWVGDRREFRQSKDRTRNTP